MSFGSFLAFEDGRSRLRAKMKLKVPLIRQPCEALSHKHLEKVAEFACVDLCNRSQKYQNPEAVQIISFF
jgi:hypothetical protein